MAPADLDGQHFGLYLNTPSHKIMRALVRQKAPSLAEPAWISPAQKPIKSLQRAI
jgi:hypothetical protein